MTETAEPITEVTDSNGNRATIAYWGDEATARASLATLTDCDYCSGCSGCSRCSDCSRCSGCSRCSRCSDCSDLEGASPISDEARGPPPIPTIPDIHKAVYAAASAPKALNMREWHACQNTHCRAGWAVTLAGEAGKKLEQFYNTPLAAMLIYDASDPIFKINPGRFFDANTEALADMKRLAEI
jgi:hypothetical protein